MFFNDAKSFAQELSEPTRDRHEVFCRFYETCWPAVVDDILRFDRQLDRSAAEDLAQDSFLRAYRGIDRLEQPGTFPGWFWTICCNVVRNRHRSPKNRPHISLDESLVSGYHDDARVTVEPELLKDLLTTLGLLRFLVVIFRYDLGFSNGETAHLLRRSRCDISRLSSPKTLARRGGERLASYLGEGEHRS